MQEELLGHLHNTEQLISVLTNSLVEYGVRRPVEVSPLEIYEKGGGHCRDPATLGSGLDVFASEDSQRHGHQASADDRFWAYNQLGFPQYHQVYQGRNVRVAHPDTGFIAHPEMDPDRVLTDIDWDFYDGDVQPNDRDGAHGLSTASVLVSGLDGHLKGASPECEVVPLRVTANRAPDAVHFFPDGVVLLWSGVIRLHKAIEYAITHECVHEFGRYRLYH